MPSTMSLVLNAMSIGYWETKLKKSIVQAWPTIRNNWHLGVTAFGGPPVHFKIVRKSHLGHWHILTLN